jgi:hypothetical protein
VKTRTLLLLALGCGVAILLAGGVLLVQLATRSDVDEAVPVGVEQQVGDVEVTVERAAEDAEVLEVVVTVGGVDDPDGLDGFRLIAAARPARRLTPPIGEPPGCEAITVAVTSCRLAFDVGGADGSSRVLFFERGDAQVRWRLDPA